VCLRLVAVASASASAGAGAVVVREEVFDKGDY